MPVAVLPDAMHLVPASPWSPIDAPACSTELAGASRDAIVAIADRIVRRTFDVVGIVGLSYGTPVNWQLDPLSGRTATLAHWSRVPYLDHERVGDHKVTWELNRHQWLIPLGQAWRLTGDTRYPTAAAELLREWLLANPPKQGINWCSALELAFRVQSWIHALRFFDGAAEIDETLRRDLIASAALQVEHIARNLSTWFSPNTHLTGEALALLSAGCAWPQLPHAERWRTLGWQILCDELPRQLRPDGVYFEQSAWYQSYTLDFYLLGMQWARFAGLPIPGGMPDRVRAAARALRAVTRPDGTIARLGDDDGGRTLPLSVAPFGDMSDSLWRAAAMLDDDSLIPPSDAGRSSLLWLEGSDTYLRMGARTASMSGRSSSAFRDGGWVTLVEQAPSADRDHWLVLDAGPHGALSHAHSHADALGIDLSLHGVPVLVDAGTGAYVGTLRRRYRSTAVHNTVTVDGSDSSEQGTSFNWRSATDSMLDGFGSCVGGSFVAASHDGYRRLADPVRHHRTILRIDRHYWIMFDALDAKASHQVSITLQAAPDAQVRERSPQAFDIEVGDVRLQVALDPAMDGAVESRTVSPAYALQLPAPAVVASATIRGAQTFCTAFGSDLESGPLDVTAGPQPRVWRIAHRTGSDLVARPAGTSVTVGPARFDGAVLAILDAAAPHTVVAAGAGTLHLAGLTVSMGADDIRVARCAPDGTWTMES